MSREITNIHTVIKDNMKIAVQEEIEKHQKLGQSIVIAKDGKPVILTPEKILVEMDTVNPK